MLVLLATPAFAQSEGEDFIDCAARPAQCIALPPKEAAELVAKAAELEAVQRQVVALAALIEAQDRQIAALTKLVALQDQEIERRSRITALADEERDVYKERAERVAKDAKKGALSLRIQGRAGAGALAGAALIPIFPPAPLLGAAAGALYGLIEHWVLD